MTLLFQLPLSAVLAATMLYRPSQRLFPSAPPSSDDGIASSRTEPQYQNTCTSSEVRLIISNVNVCHVPSAPLSSCCNIGQSLHPQP